MIRNIQLLRAVAAILVVICHSTGQWGTSYPFAVHYGFALGFTGVDLFFVISGYVVTSVALKGLQSHSRFSALENYSFSRVARIFPIYWIAIITASIVSSFTTGSPTEGAKVSFFKLATLTGLSPALGVAWSLQFELLFYGIVGLAMLAGRRRFLAIVLSTFVLYGVGIIGYQLVVGQKTFFANPIILDFLWGALVFAVLNRWGARAAPMATIVGIGGVLFGTYLMMDGPWGHYLERPFYLGLPSAVLLYGAIGFERRWSAGQIWVYVGDASYSIYLWHAVVFHQIRILDFKPYPSLIAGLISVLFMVALGTASYRFIELPIANAIKVGRRKGQAALAV